MNKRKLIAPIIVTVVLLAYFILFALGLLLIEPARLPIKIVMVVVPLLFAGVAVAMFWERFKEIKSGEEDDLSEY